MAELSHTPDPPYYAVIFTSLLPVSTDDYQYAARRMLELAQNQPGFLGVDSAREDELGITVSYWRDLDSIHAWREHAEHRVVREQGRANWYAQYRLRVCRVEKEYGWVKT